MKSHRIMKVITIDPGHASNFVPIYPVHVAIFHWIPETFDLLVMLDKKSGDPELRHEQG